MAEIAGLVIGVLPIVASTIQQYGSLYKICRRYKKAHDGVEELVNCLEVQKVIFETETKLLLIAIVGLEKSNVMMNESSDTLWHDPEIASRFDEALGGSKDAFLNVIGLARTRMKKMEKEINELGGNVSATGAGNPGRKSWVRGLKERFNFAFSESKLSAMATAIREMTTDHRVLSTQVRERLSFKNNYDEHRNFSWSPWGVEPVQSAATQVYKALSAACRLHDKHLTCFGLNFKYSETHSKHKFEFPFAFQPINARTPPLRDSSVVLKWLTITAELEKDASAATNALPGRGNLQASEPRFGRDIDLCTQLFTNPQPCGPIGWLEEAAKCNPQVHLESRPATSKHARLTPGEGPRVSSLDEVLKPHTSGVRRISMGQRLNLANVISSAVLKLHTTPWTHFPWNSRNLMVYHVVPASGSVLRVDSLEAFVEVSIRVSTNETTKTKTPKNSSPFIPNQALFDLGILLLELAFETPFPEMCASFTIGQAGPVSDIEIQTAFWWSEEVSTCLGAKYAEIVKKCLRCDFGHGSDLATAALQHAFEDQVLLQMERLELSFRQLGIA